jgi:cytochrome b involved in lipid metabolism
LDTILVVGSTGSGGGALPSAPRLGEGVSGEDCLSISGAVQQHEHEHPGKRELFPSYHGIRCKARLCHGVPFPAASAPASTRQEGGGVGTQYYTMEQVSTHCTMTDCWLAAGGKVYDSTDFLQLHPGGAGSITRRAGGNATQDMKFHSAKSMRFWKAMEIGFVCQCVPKGMKKHPGGRQASSCSLQ